MVWGDGVQLSALQLVRAWTEHRVVSVEGLRGAWRQRGKRFFDLGHHLVVVVDEEGPDVHRRGQHRHDLERWVAMGLDEAREQGPSLQVNHLSAIGERTHGIGGAYGADP